MLKFDDLINGLEDNKDRIEDYFVEFFSRGNYKQYEVDGDPDKDERKAIRVMFESRKKLRDRIEESFSYDPFCLEAFFAYYIILRYYCFILVCMLRHMPHFQYWT